MPSKTAIKDPIINIPSETIKPNRNIGKIGLNNAGSIWLRISNCRDVFYAEEIEIPMENHDLTQYMGIIKPSIGTGQKWFDGTKDLFFEIGVDVENTIIEGFYEDEIGNQNYEVTIYLEVE